MSLTPEDLKAIRDIVVHHKCRFALDDDDAKEIPHAVGMLSDLGGGELRAGVEIVRDNHKWIASTRGMIGKAASIIGGTIVGAIAAGLCGVVWVGFKIISAAKGQL